MRNLLRLFIIFLFALLLSYGLYILGEQLTSVSLPKEGDETVLFSNQLRDDLTKVYLQSIREAESSILLLIYNLSEPTITHELRRKAEEGVDVTVICDANASRSAKKYLGDKVKVYRRSNKGLMHLKILVVDERLTLLGSANLSRQSLVMHGNLVMAFNNQSMAEYIKERSIDAALGIHDRAKNAKHFIVGGQEAELWFLPNDRQAVDRMLKLIDQAQKTVRIAMYTWTRRDFAEAVVRSSLRGVSVEVALDRDSSKSASKKIARYLQREKIPLFINRSAGLLHHKFLVIDNHTLVNGSANWTKAAFTKNNDCFVILHNLTEEQLSVLNALWKTTKLEAAPYSPGR